MPPSSSERECLRDTFVSQNGWFGAKTTALQPDASFRRYFRLERAGVSAMLMDARTDYTVHYHRSPPE